ncbi:MAG: SpoIIE family protein phosphatase [Bacteroidales bacterium]|nr:SpoIIE family protein phosphatase [Bacteroidales bacterium]
MRLLLCVILLLSVSLASAVVSDGNVVSKHKADINEFFTATVDSFRNSYINGKFRTARMWVDAAYRSVCDSDTYYAYQCIDYHMRDFNNSHYGPVVDIDRVIDYFGLKSDSFAIRMLATAYCAKADHIMHSDVDRALLLYDTSIALSDKIGDESFSAYSVMQKSEAYQCARNYVEAAKCSREVLNSSVSQTYPNLRFMAQTQLYKIYSDMRAVPLAEQYGRAIEKEGVYMQSLTLESRYLFRKVDFLISTKRYDEALEVVDRLLQIVDLVGTKIHIWRADLQAAKVLSLVGRYAEAKEHVLKCRYSSQYAKEYKQTSMYSSYHLDLIAAIIAVEEGRYDKAYVALERSNPPAEMLEILDYAMPYYRCKEMLYERTGDYRNAVLMASEINKLHEKSFEIYAIQRAKDLDNVYSNDTTILSQGILLAQQDSEMNTAQAGLVFASLALLIIILLVVIVRQAIERYRKRENERLDLERREKLRSEIRRQTRQLEAQKNEITRRNDDILQSQSYAQLIQQGVLPEAGLLNYPEFGGAFVIYKPVNVVSGDFYWFRKFGDVVVVCCADCSGQGIPGAMMTMVGLTILSDITRNCKTFVASELLGDFDNALVNMMPDIRRTDAIDVALAVIDTGKKSVNISLAHEDVVFISKGEVSHIVGDNRHVGFVSSSQNDAGTSFTRFKDYFFEYEKGDTLYMYTDGVEKLFYGSRGVSGNANFIDIFTQCNTMPIGQRASWIEGMLAGNVRKSDTTDDYSIIGIEL